MTRSPKRLVVSCIAVFTLASCSSGQQQTAKESVEQIDASCKKVRELNEEIEALNLDETGSKALDDPKTQELLEKAASATSELSKQIEEAANKDEGAIGKLKRSFDKNRELIDDVVDFAETESKDSLRDKARQLRKVADIVGADSCAS